MVQKRSFCMNVTNLKRVRRRALTRMRKQNTTLKSHIRLTIVSFNKLCIILDIYKTSHLQNLFSVHGSGYTDLRNSEIKLNFPKP